jgi:Putative restriction endonuclease
MAGGGIDWPSPILAEPPSMKRATYEDVLKAPENKVAEILDGELVLSPRPAPRHSVASSRLGGVLAPDWVCEVLSPSTQKTDRSRKLRIYAEAGVAHAWLLDPLERTLEVLRLKDAAWTIVRVCVDADVVRIHPFEAIQLELGRLWPDAPPPTPASSMPDAG